jgi:hypothetical protein
MKLNTTYLKLVANDIYQHFHSLDNPPADEIHVPVELMEPSRKEPDTYTAIIKFVVDYCGKRTHTVRIKFAIDPKGRFIRNSWNYV